MYAVHLSSPNSKNVWHSFVQGTDHITHQKKTSCELLRSGIPSSDILNPCQLAVHVKYTKFEQVGRRFTCRKPCHWVSWQHNQLQPVQHKLAHFRRQPAILGRNIFRFQLCRVSKF